MINENIKKFNVIDTEIDFSPEEKKVINFLSIIKNFGNIFFYKKEEKKEEIKEEKKE